MLNTSLKKFIEHVQSTEHLELYNEAGLQHELALYLRQNLSGYKIQLERNVEAILGSKKGFYKKEIDIYLSKGNHKYAIELKVCVNGQVPRRMELAFNDVRFLEQLKERGFTRCYLLFASNVVSFWGSGRTSKIYEYFNDGIVKTLTKSDVPRFIQNTPGAFIPLKNAYSFEWQDLKKHNNRLWRYFIVSV